MSPDAIWVAAAIAASAYFVASTIAGDKIFARARRVWAEAGWGSLEAAYADVDNTEVTIVATLSDKPPPANWREARVMTVPPNSPLAYHLGLSIKPQLVGHVDEDEHGLRVAGGAVVNEHGPPPFVLLDVDHFADMVDQPNTRWRDHYRRQLGLLHRVRMTWRLAFCAMCSGFWIHNIAWAVETAIGDRLNIDWQSGALLALSHALRRITTRRYEP